MLMDDVIQEDRTTQVDNTSALIIVDVQYDFLPGGSLAIENGDKIIKPINKIVPLFQNVIVTQDWHPKGHVSFASSHKAGLFQPFDVIEVINEVSGNPIEQMLWPDHCVQGSKGAKIHKSLKVDNARLILRKGIHKNLDSYSALFENDEYTPTGLQEYLHELGVTNLFICGLATDYCVLFTALDALAQSFSVIIINDCVAGVDEWTSAQAIQNILNDGGLLTNTHMMLRDNKKGE